MRRSILLAALLAAASPIHAASHVAAEDSAGDEAGALTTETTATETNAADTTATDTTATDTTDSDMSADPLADTMIAADAIEGAMVYTLGEAYDQSLWDGEQPFGPVAADWAEIGDVEDVIVSGKGQVLGVTVDVGGFIGIGERTVLVPIDDLRLVQSPENGFFIVTRMQRAEFETAEEIDGIIGD